MAYLHFVIEGQYFRFIWIQTWLSCIVRLCMTYECGISYSSVIFTVEVVV